jgi:Na+-transporting methylmalonyl-CoA/oxaloacetate decarboxylase gamma subunit
MSEQHNTNDELDLKSVLDWIQNTFKKALILVFMAVQFVFKFWIVLLVLILAGIGLGYYFEKQNVSYKESEILIQINNKNVNYVYNAIEKLNRKRADRDSVFMSTNGFDKGKYDLVFIEIVPVINIDDLIDKYDEVNNASLNVFVDIVPFEEEEEKMLESEAFLEEYKYHKIKILTGPVGVPEIAEKIVVYLNANPVIKEMGKSYYQNTLDRIEANKRTITQMDAVIENYSVARAQNTSVPTQFIVERSMNIERVFEEKIDLQDATEVLQAELLKRKETVVQIGNSDLVNVESFMNGKRMTIYPIIFVFIFLFLAFLRYIYLLVKELAEEEKRNKISA